MAKALFPLDGATANGAPAREGALARSPLKQDRDAASQKSQCFMFLYGSPKSDSRVRRAANALVSSGFQVRVYARGEEGEVKYDLDEVTVHELSVREGVVPGGDSPFRRGGRTAESILWLFRYLRTLLHWCRETASEATRLASRGPVIWHGHDLTGLIAADRAKRLSGGKGWMIYDSHELLLESGAAAAMPSPVRYLFRRLEKRLIRRCDGVITVNDSIAAELRKRYGVLLPVVVRNCPPAGPEALPRDSSPLRAALGLAGRDIVLFHGGLGPNRGIEQLLAASKDLPLTAALVFLGNGPLRQLIQQAAGKMAGRIFWHPAVPLSELSLWVAGADVGVIPFQPVNLNNYLASPNKLFECLAAGVPVVVSDSPEMRAVVDANRVGVTCDPASPSQIAEAVLSLLSENAGTKAERRRRCRNLAVDRYCWEKESAKLVGLYEQILLESGGLEMASGN